MSTLYPFQKTAITRVAKGDQVYLGFDPGLGKSRTALEGAEKRGAKRVLVLCHASGLYVWQEQVKLWSSYQSKVVRAAADLHGDGVKIVTYGMISKTGSPIAAAIGKGFSFDMSILDEAAALKNLKATRTKLILGPMLPKLGYVLPLSGTPAPNHAGELYPILRALYPKALMNGAGGALAQWQFEDRFCNVRMAKFGKTEQPTRVIEGSKNLADLRQRISPFMIRVRKEMVLKDLPPVRYDIVPIGVDTTAAAQLPIPPDVGLDDDDLMAYLNGHGHVMEIRHMLGMLKVKPAIDYIIDLVDSLPRERKVLVFAHHRDVVEALMQGLVRYNPVAIHGGSTTAERDKAVTTFLTDAKCQMFIGNIQAAGTGLTLVGPTCRCSDVVFVEASYSVGDNSQAAARVHRIGQHEAVIARFLTAHDTIDDRIQEILARKARDFSQLFD